MATFSDAPWNGSASSWPSTADYCDDCLINTNTGPRDGWTQDNCHLPVKKNGTYYRSAIRNALSRISQVQGGGTKGAAAKLHALAKAAGIGQD